MVNDFVEGIVLNCVKIVCGLGEWIVMGEWDVFFVLGDG